MLPDRHGRYGRYGGRFVPETLMPALLELEEAYRRISREKEFKDELAWYLKDYVGRPTPLYFARHLTAALGGPQIYIKREDLAHTGAHKINNTLGQGLLARRMGKKRLIAETGAGQHGVATATVAALLGMECDIYMGTEDIRRQRLNVIRMRLLGSRVIPVDSGSRTLKDAMNEAIRDWVTNVRHTHYVLGSVGGPHPYPMIVRDFQSVIGKEAKAQLRRITGRLPQCLVACVGGGSNAMGLFHAFVNDPVRFVGVEAAGHGLAAATTPPPWWPGRWACCTAPSVTSCKTPGATSRRPIPWRRGWIIPGSARSTPISRTRAGRIRGGERCRGPGGLQAALPHRRHPAGPGKRPCGGLSAAAGAGIHRGRHHYRQSFRPGRQRRGRGGRGPGGVR